MLTVFFCPDSYHVNFSYRPGDFGFKLVASSKIQVAMATKMVATWRVDNITASLTKSKGAYILSPLIM